MRSTGHLRRLSESHVSIAGQNRPLERRLARQLGLAQRSGVEAVSVEKSGPAAEAGVREGDIVLALAGEATATVDDIHRALNTWPIGSALELQVLRRGEVHTLTLTPREARG